MDAFLEALTAGENKIPPEFDWFAPLLGDWDFTYTDGLGGGRAVQGEWLFRRALNGTGIEDLFICPSRATMADNPQPDGEYGAAIRMFNAKMGCYDMAYCCQGQTRLLTFVKEGERLVGTPADSPAGKWVFSEIGEDTFHWQNCTVGEDGAWRVNSDVYARRREASAGFAFFPQFDRLENGDMTLRIIEKKEGGRVQIPYYYYEILVNDVPVGKISIRIGDNFHTYYNGHIGYEVNEDARGCGYARRACELVLEVARAHEMSRLYVTCAEDNAPSYRTIERLGGRLLEICEMPREYFAWYEGIPRHRIYQLDL